MAGKILWVDSDRTYLDDYLLRLRAEGFEVKQAYSLAEGLDEIKKPSYELLILDCLMPVQDEEQAVFSPEESDCGKKAGLVFLRHARSILEKNHTRVLVFTIRDERWLRQEFIEGGLPEESFLTKSDGAETNVFLDKVRQVLRKQ